MGAAHHFLELAEAGEDRSPPAAAAYGAAGIASSMCSSEYGIGSNYSRLVVFDIDIEHYMMLIFTCIKFAFKKNKKN